MIYIKNVECYDSERGNQYPVYLSQNGPLEWNKSEQKLGMSHEDEKVTTHMLCNFNILTN
jgi:hypothetical protein